MVRRLVVRARALMAICAVAGCSVDDRALGPAPTLDAGDGVAAAGGGGGVAAAGGDGVSERDCDAPLVWDRGNWDEGCWQ
ncbi:MAG: hypothetical protein ABW217_16765 [Polyangiaceae bacterium]